MTEPYYQDGRVTLHAGDCLDVLATLPDASVDAVVTDPPYGLANTTPAQVADTLTRWVNGERDYLPSGRGFMGHEWDGFVPPVAVWDECLRVLKPGGHMAVFAGSRTQDLMGLAIRLAGFDIRDSVAYLFGSGFPKSLDVSKAIDKAAHAMPLWDEIRAHLRHWRDEAGMTNPDLNAALGLATNGAGMARHWTSEVGGQHSIPSKAMWRRLKALLCWPDCDLDSTYDAVKDGASRPVVGIKPGTRLAVAPGQGEDRSQRHLAITAPGSEDAAAWQGFGTALKPGHEPIILARKPFKSTVAANVLAHGTGALNIDGCRIEGGFVSGWSKSGSKASDNDSMSGPNYARDPKPDNPSGRWPANVVLDETQAEALDQQSGESTSVQRTGRGTGKDDVTSYGKFAGQDVAGMGHNDQGGASRYFFVSSTSANGELLTETGTTPTCAPIESLGNRFFYTAKADSNERPRVDGVAHPTVKSLTLMRWLVRLVTPPGGKVLDPFAGSGTTGEAALLEGFQAILIERETDYLPLITQRIHRRLNPVEAIRQTGGDLGLFGEPT